MTDLAERRGEDWTVYEPAEDSHLLATACADELTGEEAVLDVGTGTGYVAAQLHAETGAHVVGVDVNPYACRRAAARGIPVVRANLVEAFRANTFDVIVCNPPYLPTEEDDARDDWLGVAVAGGETGRSIVESLLPDARRVLRPDGEMFLLVSSLMDIDAVRSLARSAGFAVEELDRDASFPFEVLAVLALRR